MAHFAVIDTETNWNDSVMSAGVVIADRDTFETAEKLYFVFSPEYKTGGMFSWKLPLEGRDFQKFVSTRKTALDKIKAALEKYGVTEIFAYNALFDKNHLPELAAYTWYDIMKIAAYRQYNDKIPPCTECFSTGRMKRSYGVEPMMRMLSDNCRYEEEHNALFDAADELEIMRLLGRDIDGYAAAKI